MILRSSISLVLGLAIGLGLVTTGPVADAASGPPVLPWQTGPGYRSAPLHVSREGKAGFELETNAPLGILFTNTLSIEAAKTNNNLMNGAGVAAGDFDGDGWCDLYFCDLGGSNRLYRNLGGWRFEDVTIAAGATTPQMASTGAAFADVNGDGWLDLIVTACGGPNALLINDGHGHFVNRTEASGLSSTDGATSIALADVDGDGDLDLYIANYANLSILRSGGAINMRMVDGKPVVIGPFAKRIRIDNGKMRELGEPDVLFINDGHGVFTPLSWTSEAFLDEGGVPLKAPPQELGLSVLFHDLNNDGAPDLYICNDYEGPDRIWINNGKGQFRALPILSLRQSSQFSMSADVADLNRDGFNDLFVVDMLSRFHELRMTQMGSVDPAPRVPGVFQDRPQIRRNTLHLARGDGTFAEVANRTGVQASDWSWCAAFLDVDLDGYEDLLVANGHAFDIQDIDTLEAAQRRGKPASVEESRNALLQFPSLQTPNGAFRNLRGVAFEENGNGWGFDSRQVSHGIALADLDNDGDADVVVNCLNAPPLLYRNLSSAPRIAVRLRGTDGNTHGIGGRIRVMNGPVTQSQEIIAGGRYLSGDQASRTFAAGSEESTLTIQVDWRDGRQSSLVNARANQIYEISQQDAVRVPVKEVPATRPLFSDVSPSLGHQHHEDVYDDFTRQPLLPRKLSQLGPGVSWFDLDQDGRVDLLLGSGRGGPLSAFHNLGGGHFAPWSQAPFLKNTAGDHATILGWHGAGDATTLLVGRSNYEDESTPAPSVVAYHFTNAVQTTTDRIIGIPSSVGPMALADIDGDGDLDLFVGGRVIPGRYPAPAESRVFLSQDGKLVPDPILPPSFQTVGLVSAALFTDLDGDGLPELVVPCEWGSVQIWSRRAEGWKDRTQEFGIPALSGWWTSVTAGDFDGDGRMDLLLGNWGLNSAYTASSEKPLRLAFGEWSDSGTLDLLETEFEGENRQLLPRRDLLVLGAVWPELKTRFTTHRQFSTATVADLLGSRAPTAQWVEATTLKTTLLIRKDARFEVQPLPDEVQWAPVMGTTVADFDGDGAEDIILGQNFFANAPDMPRNDAGRGLLLRGTGRGDFRAMAGSESGILVYGEQRGVASADFDEDGRTDLVITQNGTTTRLFHNSEGKPGLRVRLVGGNANPDAIGTQLRLKSGDRMGPIREIRAGSGYWSQDSSVPVLTAPFAAKELWVRWPGGTTGLYSVQEAQKEIRVSDPRWNESKGAP